MPGLLPADISSLILDMDGVLWKMDEPIGNLPAIFERIRARGLKVVFATNNGTQTPGEYAQRLAKHGVTVEPWQILTSAIGVTNLLLEKFPSGGPIFAIGGPGVMAELRQHNFELLSIEDAPNAQAVVMGVDWEITYDKLREATLLVRRGVPFYATNPDKTFPTPRGQVPGAGALIAVIVTATGIEPTYAGKPAPYLIDLARERLCATREQILVVGDRLETDISGGQAAGCRVALVLSGVSQLEQAQAWTPKVDLIAQDLSQLVE